MKHIFAFAILLNSFCVHAQIEKYQKIFHDFTAMNKTDFYQRRGELKEGEKLCAFTKDNLYRMSLIYKDELWTLCFHPEWQEFEVLVENGSTLIAQQNYLAKNGARLRATHFGTLLDDMALDSVLQTVFKVDLDQYKQ